MPNNLDDPVAAARPHAMSLLASITLGSITAPNRVLFGPHPTNLADGRRFSQRHVAYYERRARGGCGVVVTEEASVHPSDWPYERSPLASQCQPGWRSIVDALHTRGSLVIAALGHSGGQGSSAFSQRELWAPSRVPEVNSREVPKWMDSVDIRAVIDGFGDATRIALEAGCDGIEINAGQHSLIRQFLSGLTNQRDDEWGHDRLAFATAVLERCRVQARRSAVIGLRLSCDELAPWAGITPALALPIATSLAPLVDYIVVVRGSIFSVEKTRPDYHEPSMFNLDLTRAVKQAIGTTPVVLQGSVVDVGAATAAIDDRSADLVEMTRAQIADPDLVAKLAAGTIEQIRPCIRCNQTCQVRDPRNPLVTCVAEPSSGHETDDPDWYRPATTTKRVHVIGGGPAGLEAARVAAQRGCRVTLFERDAHLGGTAGAITALQPLTEWLEREVRRLGVDIKLNAAADSCVDGCADAIIQCTGSRPGERAYTVAPDANVVDVSDLRRGGHLLPEHGPVAIYDPIGGPIAVALAEELGERATLITQDNVAGNELSRTGDLAPANTRLAQRAVSIERRALLRAVGRDHVIVEDRYTGARRTIPAAALVDCGFRLPDEPMAGVTASAGDCVAPRTILEAILEGRRAGYAV